MTQGIINIITVLAFALAMLTWFGITPQRLRELTKEHVLKNWFTVVSIMFACSGIVLIILNLRLDIHNWWLYAEASWISIYFWLILIHTRLKDWRARLLEIIIRIAPTMFLFTSFGRLDNALKSGVFEDASPSFDKWMILGICGFYVLMVGFNAGASIYSAWFEKRTNELSKKINKIVLSVEELEEKLESASDESESSKEHS